MKSGLKILLGLVALILVGGFSFFVYDPFFANKTVGVQFLSPLPDRNEVLLFQPGDTVEIEWRIRNYDLLSDEEKEGIVAQVGVFEGDFNGVDLLIKNDIPVQERIKVRWVVPEILPTGRPYRFYVDQRWVVKNHSRIVSPLTLNVFTSPAPFYIDQIIPR